MKTLILTDSYDATTDILVNYIGSEKIFRFNYDFMGLNKIKISNGKIYLDNGTYKTTNLEIKKVLWRKPFNHHNNKYDKYFISEYKYIFREIFNLFRIHKKTILVIPQISNTKGKLVQMEVAKKYFTVPSYELTLNVKTSLNKGVVKSLSSERVGKERVLYTTRTDFEKLSKKYPWFCQEEVISKRDVTIVYVNGKIFSFALKRENDIVDWRKEIFNKNQIWHKYKLKNEIRSRIVAFMNECELKFGRLDFLEGENELIFLEVNPNGQWAWLDIENKNGLMREMIKNVTPDNNILARV